MRNPRQRSPTVASSSTPRRASAISALASSSSSRLHGPSRRKPKVLVLDEPTAALSRNEIDALLAQLRTLRERGVACVFISHKLDEVFAIADRITVLRDGSAQGTLDVAGTDADEIIRRMVGRRIEDHYPRRQSTPGRTLLALRDVDVDPRVRAASPCTASISMPEPVKCWESAASWARGAPSSCCT